MQPAGPDPAKAPGRDIPPPDVDRSYHGAAAPSLVALFLVKFDLKVGYTIAWKRKVDKVVLEGVVEYKGLPSGLHNVDKDLVYFVHDKYAGVSAFAKGEASQSERNAHFVAVGAMLPLKDGRLGRAWLHAGSLENLASQLVLDSSRVDLLEEYWEAHGVSNSEEDVETPQASPFTAAKRKSRAMSTFTLSEDRQTLPVYHPAMSVLSYIDTFGPLIFPLHRLALLRKRILFVTAPPVRQTCEFVYDLSMFSSTPSSLPVPTPPLARLRPLFNVGIHDITFLEKISPNLKASDPLRNGGASSSDHTDGDPDQEPGWLACTTDEILAMKPALYDVLVELPSSHVSHPKGGRYPIIRTVEKSSEGKKGKTRQTRVKATQRDFRRFRLLRRAMRPVRESVRWERRHRADEDLEASSPHPARRHQHPTTSDDEESRVPLLFRPPTTRSHTSRDSSLSSSTEQDEDEEQLVEPTTWSELAYGSFMWWASAGERDENDVREEETDADMLAEVGRVAEDIAGLWRYRDEEGLDEDAEERIGEGVGAGAQDDTEGAPGANGRASSTSVGAEEEESPVLAGSTATLDSVRKNATLEIALIAYFHLLSKTYFDVCADVIAHPGGSDDEQDVPFAPAGRFTMGDSGEGDRGDWEEGDEDLEGEDTSYEDDDETTGLLRRRRGAGGGESAAVDDELDRGNHDADDDDEPPPVRLDSQDMRRLGLDVWSRADAKFVVEFCGVWFGRRVEVVGGGGVECCGVRIC